MMISRAESNYFNQEIFKKEISRIIYTIENASIGHYAKSYETWKRTQNIIRCFKEELKNKEISLIDKKSPVDIGKKSKGLKTY